MVVPTYKTRWNSVNASYKSSCVCHVVRYARKSIHRRARLQAKAEECDCDMAAASAHAAAAAATVAGGHASAHAHDIALAVPLFAVSHTQLRL